MRRIRRIRYRLTHIREAATEARDTVAGTFDALRVYDAALREVNRARRALGLLPILLLPRGFARDSSACPLANALTLMLREWARGTGWAHMPSALYADVDGEHVRFHGAEESVGDRVARAWHTYAREGWNGSVIPSPEPVSVFVTAFDNGALTHLRA